jgi:CheY-like chemotaxis protein
MLGKLLSTKGVSTRMAEDGKSALDLVCSDIDAHRIIFMDNLMPIMSGVEAAARLRAAGYPYIIVGITGNVMEEDIDEYLRAGANIVFSKPLQSRLLDMLVSHVRQNGSLAEPSMILVEKFDQLVWSQIV